MHGGGRAGVHVGGWQNAGYNLEDLKWKDDKIMLTDQELTELLVQGQPCFE